MAVIMFAAGLALTYWSWQPVGREASLAFGNFANSRIHPDAAFGDQTVAAMM